MARKVKISVEIDGKEIPTISSLSIDQKMGWHHIFELFCSIEEKENTLIEQSDKYIGGEISVHVFSEWYGGGDEVVFKGIVTRVALTRKQGMGTGIIFAGYSPTIRMENGPNCRSFTEKKLNDIFKELTADSGVDNVEVNPRYADVIPYVVQYKESEFQFLTRQAALYSEWWYYDGIKLNLGKPKGGKTKVLKLGKELHDFDLGLNLGATNFDLQGYDYLNTNVLESKSKSGPANGQDQYGKLAMKKSENIFNGKPLMTTPLAVSSKSDLDGFLDRKRSAEASKQVTLNGTSDHPFLKLGDTISIQGVVYSDSGNASEMEYGEFIITELIHNSSGVGNYKNKFKAITATVEIPLPNPYAKMAVSEAQEAVVIDNRDPEGLGRIQVRFHWQKEPETTPYIRLAASAGGASQGFYFVPELDDEVLVGFEHGNPDSPYVIGSVYNSNSKPSGVQDNDNNKKTILTKSGNQIILDDTPGDETISILNLGNKIVLSMTDESIVISNNGDIKLEAENITIKASDSIKMEATGHLTAEAGSKMELSGGTALEGSAPQVKIAASATAEVTASANLKLESSGMTEVKGSLIKLN